MNYMEITKKDISQVKLVCSGAEVPAGIACLELFKKFGVSGKNTFLCDEGGVVYPGREDLADYKKEYAHRDVKCKVSLEYVAKDADIYIGCSAPEISFSQDIIERLNKNPLIFSLTPPEKFEMEEWPKAIKYFRADAIVVTNLPSYPNYIHPGICYPFLFRGTLDTKCKTISIEMKLKAAIALAWLAKEPILDEVQLLASPGTEL